MQSTRQRLAAQRAQPEARRNDILFSDPRSSAGEPGAPAGEPAGDPEAPAADGGRRGHEAQRHKTKQTKTNMRGSRFPEAAAGWFHPPAIVGPCPQGGGPLGLRPWFGSGRADPWPGGKANTRSETTTTKKMPGAFRPRGAGPEGGGHWRPWWSGRGRADPLPGGKGNNTKK